MDVALSAVLASLCRCCEEDNHYEVTRLFQNNTLIRSTLTIFTLPTFPNCPDCVQIALKYLPETNICCRGALDRNALIAAIVLGEGNHITKSIEALCNHDDAILVHQCDALGRTPLHYAVIRGDLEILKIIANKDPNFKATDNDGNSILHQFFLFNVKNETMLKFLLDISDVKELIHQPNAPEKGQNTPAMLALRLNYDDFGVEMMKHPSGKSPDNELESINYILSNLQHIDQHEDLELLEKIIVKFATVSFEGANTLLHLIADSGLGNQAVIDFCLRDLKDHVNTTNREGETPIHVAIKSRNRTFISSLLDLSVDWPSIAVFPGLIEDSEIFFDFYNKNSSMLTLTIGDQCLLGNLVEKERTSLLIKINPDPKLLLDNGMNFLHVLAIYCKTEIMADFFNKKDLGLLVNVQDNLQRTPLMCAMNAHNTLMYHRILDLFEPDLKIMREGSNTLHIAIRSEQIPTSFIVKLLIWDPDLANTADAHGDSPIMLAVSMKRFDLAEYLVGLEEVKFDQSTHEGNNVLHYLALYAVKDIKLIEMILDRDATMLEKTNQYRQTPMEIAAAKENVELCAAFTKFLKTKQPQQITNGNEMSVKEKMLTIFGTNNIGALKQLLDITPSENWAGESPLHLVTYFPEVSPEILEYLLEDSDINVQNLLGETPLHLAALRGHLPLLTMMLPHADLFRKNYKGETALLAAINVAWEKINLDVIHIMLKHAPLLAMIPSGATEMILETDRKGSIERPIMAEKGTPLEIAIKRNLFDVVKMLVELAKVEINYVTLEGNLILHHLAPYQHQDERIMQYLLFTCKAFRYVNKRNNAGNTPLHCAAKYNNFRYVQRLLSSKKIEVKVTNHMKESPLFLALANNGKATSCELVKALVDKYPNMVNIPNHIGDLPINLALNAGNPDLVKIIIEDGKINFDKWRDRHKNTLLHFIGLYNIQDRFLCTYLISKAGPKVVNEKNVVGQTILHFMCADDHPSLKSLLDHPNIDVTVHNANGTPPLMDYLEPDRDFSEDILATLVKVPLCAADKNGMTPIKRAIELYQIRDPVVVNSANANTKKPLIVMLQKGPIDFNYVDATGNSLFHVLAENVRDEELLRLFLGKFVSEDKSELSQQMERKNKEDKTPIDVARANKNDIFIDVIELS